ncbi:MAG: uroporphyrinogen decarboxylase family protein [Bryobacteraceae bacterium]
MSSGGDFGAGRLSSKERVDRALRGEDVDRPPFTFWLHFRLHKFPGDRHAAATLDFHRRLRTDLVKVMSDFPYPRPAGEWYELHEIENPFPEQLRALELIRDGLAGKAYFVETLFNPWNRAVKLSSPAEVQRLMAEKPQALLDALEAIARSQIHHARRAIEIGASGIFLAIANAQDGILSPGEYAKFSEPFDKMILEAVASSPLNVLHLHGEKLYFEPFYSGWKASLISYSIHETGKPMAEVRRRYSGVLMGGLDEINFRKLTPEELKQQWQSAQAAAGRRFILSPGCSVPDDTQDEELLRLVNLLGA